MTINAQIFPWFMQIKANEQRMSILNNKAYNEKQAL